VIYRERIFVGVKRPLKEGRQSESSRELPGGGTQDKRKCARGGEDRFEEEGARFGGTSLATSTTSQPRPRTGEWGRKKEGYVGRISIEGEKYGLGDVGKIRSSISEPGPEATRALKREGGKRKLKNSFGQNRSRVLR